MFRCGAVSRGESGSGLAGKASQGNVRCCGVSSGVAGKVSRGNVWTVCRGVAGLVGRGVTRQGKVGCAKAWQAWYGNAAKGKSS